MEGNHTTHKDYHPMDMVIPFEKLPFGAVVVDVGGGRGHNALRLATKFQHITVIVQDHESVIFPAEDEIKVPSSVEGRIQFHPHDYYDPQPIKDADVYILSNILMDNPERYQCNLALRLHVHTLILLYQ
jgi:tRNA1(Val) A37 N6-methylase TrmN6